jgi:tripartite ATP-independent transporter DctM subunit
MIAFSMFGALILLMMLGLPVALSLGVVSSAWIMVAGRSLQMVASRMYDGMDQFVLMSIPFFCLAGEIMNHSGITDKLIQFVDYIVGRVRGGLAQANIYTSLLFAGITGAAVADVSALGTIFIPAMEKQGYSRRFSVAVTAGSSIVGPIIPPSIIIVIYGAVTGVSIGAIFAAAIVPGVVLGLSMSTYVAVIAKRRNFPKVEQPFDVKGFIRTFKDAILALIMPIIIVGGILGGIFTPTEAAAVSVFYALIVGGFIYRTVNFRTIYISVVNAMKISGMLFFIIGFANILGWILARLNLPQTIAQLLINLSDDPKITFLAVIALLIFVGTWLETGTACIILAPILSPAMKSVGIDPIHFATVMIVALNVGLITPPLGVALFAAVVVGGVSFEEGCKEIWPFIILDIVVLVLLIYVSTFSLAVPRLLGFI